MASDKQNKSGWRVVNAFILIIAVLCFPLFLIWSISVAGLTPYFIILLLGLFILIPVLYRRYRKNGKCLIALWTARISFVVVAALYAVIPLIGTRFEHNKNFYIPKKLIYTYGVYDLSAEIDEMLPEKLPDECREYRFITQLGSIAQDSHPSVYLMFYTDGETIEEYEDLFSGLPNCVKSDEIGTRSRSVLEGDKYVEVTYDHPQNFPEHIWTWLEETHKKEFLDMRDAVVYRKTDTYYSRGCLLDHDSGLVVFWT